MRGFSLIFLLFFYPRYTCSLPCIQLPVLRVGTTSTPKIFFFFHNKDTFDTEFLKTVNKITECSAYGNNERVPPHIKLCMEGEGI